MNYLIALLVAIIPITEIVPRTMTPPYTEMRVRMYYDRDMTGSWTWWNDEPCAGCDFYINIKQEEPGGITLAQKFTTDEDGQMWLRASAANWVVWIPAPHPNNRWPTACEAFGPGIFECEFNMADEFYNFLPTVRSN